MNNKRIKTTLCLIVAMMVLSPACWGQYCLFPGLLESNIKANVCKKVNGDFLDMSRSAKTERIKSLWRVSESSIPDAIESGGVPALMQYLRKYHRKYFEDIFLESEEYKNYLWWTQKKKKNTNNK